MKIIYVGKHGQTNSNDDEGAVHYALESLGHTVERLREQKGYKVNNLDGDFLLFHKWFDIDSLIHRVSCPKVFWYFDLVDFPDPSLAKRNSNRKEWMAEVTPRIDLGFCTDGDWVNNDKTGKLVRLLQGADSRIAIRGQAPIEPLPPILFTGIRNGGAKRASFVDEMQVNYRQTFNHVNNEVHGKALADLIAGSKIVVAPDAPITDNYWSNRVYLTLGFGGFLIHPYCETLTQHYEDGKEIVYYRCREELHDKIKYFYSRPDEREKIQAAAYLRTMQEHTYIDRCQKLIEIVKERLL